MDRPSPSLPIGAAEAALLFAPFVRAGEKVGLAVSGGPDSSALALCAKVAGIAARVFIVDHGLRTESAAEAEQVRQRMEKLGLKTEILKWEHGPVQSRIHVEARGARYDLLLTACRKHGISKLFLAHHRGDQAETILMRLAKGSGIEGLAGMAAESERDGVRIIRPFLNFSKEKLIATCAAACFDYVRDPSNDSSHYARGRLRAVADILAAEGLSEDTLIELGERAAEAAEAIAHDARAFLRLAACRNRFGVIELDLTGLDALPRAVAMKALSLCLLTIHPAPYAPERKQRLDLLAALVREEDWASTLHGVEIRKSGARARFVREVAAIAEERDIKPGETLLWDGRWRVSLSNGPGGVIRALGGQRQDDLHRLAPALRHDLPQGRARACLPALWRGEELVAIPVFSEENQGTIAASLFPPLWA